MLMRRVSGGCNEQLSFEISGGLRAPCRRHDDVEGQFARPMSLETRFS